MSTNSSRALFEPQGVIFNPVKRALATVRRISLTVFFLIIAAPIVVMTQILEEFPQPLLYAALVCVGLLWLYFLWLIGRQVRNLAWAQGEHDFLIRRGAFFRSMTIVPYGRIQYVDISEGPIARMFGISSIVIHTASTQTSAHLHGIPSEQAAQLRDYLAQRGSAEMAGL